MYIGQFFIIFLLFIVLSNYNPKLIFIDCILVFSLIILFTYMQETKTLNLQNNTSNNKLANNEGFKNNKKLKEFMINKTVYKKELKLNKGKRKKKEKFKNVSTNDYYNSFNDPILKKKYHSSFKSASHKLPFFIEKFKEIIK